MFSNISKTLLRVRPTKNLTLRTFTTTRITFAKMDGGNSSTKGNNSAINENSKEEKPIFDKDGAIGSAFKSDGVIGEKADKVGGPFSKDGAVGKEFEADGKIGGKVEEELGKK